MIAGYLRVSTLRQKNEGASIQTQKEMIIEHAKRFEIISNENEIVFYIDDGFSGKSLERPDMKRLIDDIKERKIELLFAYDLSRISRDIFDSNTFLKLTKKYNVVLKCLYDDVKIETASDRYKTNIVLSTNQYERERIVERTNDGLIAIAERGRYPVGGKILFGYYRGKDKQIYKHERNSEIVRNAFMMAKERYTLIEIKNYMNNAQNERHFETYEIKKMFNDLRYAGIFIYKGKQYDNIIPAIVTLEELEDARKYYRTWKFKKNEKYLFDNLVFCSCGTQMRCTHSYGRNQKYYYYLCGRCNATISQVSLEEYISHINCSTTKKESLLKEIDKERYSLNRRLKRVREKYLDKKISDRELCTLAIPIEDRLEELLFKREGLKLKKNNFHYNQGDNEVEKKKYIQSAFKKITVDPHKKIVIDVVMSD
jgi:Site-specific recombinases, DNA invertase Pin homologs